METPSDTEHLNLLRIFWFVMAGLHALGGCLPVVHLTLGLVIVKGGLFPDAKGGPPPEALGWFFIGLALAVMAVVWTIGALQFVAARRLGERRSVVFVQVVAALTCLSMPFGTLLGVFTLIVLSRPTVKAAFLRNDAHTS